MRDLRYLKGRGLLRRPRYPAADLSREIGVWDRAAKRYVSNETLAEVCRARCAMYDASPAGVRERIREYGL